MRRGLGRSAAIAALASVPALLLCWGWMSCAVAMGGNMVESLASAFCGWPAFLLQGGSLSTEPSVLAAALLGPCAVWLAWAYMVKVQGNYRTGEEHGSSRWATADEVAKYADRRHPEQNILLTRDFRLSLDNGAVDADHDHNNNVLVTGGSGSSKSFGYVANNVMQMSSSYFITDPKGTLVLNMGQGLVDHGYRLRVLNLVTLDDSMHYNPIAYLRDDIDIIEFTDCLIKNTTGDRPGASDSFWEDSERLFYGALIGYQVYYCRPEDRNISGLVTLMSLAEVRDDPGYLSPLDLLFREIETGFRVVSERHAGGKAAGGPRGFAARGGTGVKWIRIGEPTAPEKSFPLLCYRLFSQGSEKTKQSSLMTCNARMMRFFTPRIRELMSYDEMELDLMGDPGQKRAVFAIMSDTSSTLSFVFGMMLWQAVNILSKRAGELYGGALPTRVMFVMDEFANLGYLPDIQHSIAVLRSRNMSMSIILQSISQLKKTYGEDANTIVDCCDTWLYLGGKSNTTNKEVSEAIGKETVAVRNYSESRGANASSTNNYTVVERDLIQPAEVGRIKRSHAIVLEANAAPFKGPKMHPSEHANWEWFFPGSRHPECRYAEPFDVAAYRDRLREEDLAGASKTE